MNVLAIVPATQTRAGEETGVLSPIIRGAPLLSRLPDRLATADKLEAASSRRATTRRTAIVFL
jgi:hypothetical protein